MKVREVIEILDAELLCGEGHLDMEIHSAFGSDLLSDVMAYVKEDVLLLTGLMSIQTIRTAEMMDIKVVAFVRGKVPNKSMVELAKEKGIAVLTTSQSMFIACGKLYGAGITGRRCT